MKPSNRDLLVLSRKSADKKALELEVEKLNQILFHVESMDNFCLVNEIIDINTYKIIDNPAKIEKLIIRRKLKPFQFVHSKN